MTWHDRYNPMRGVRTNRYSYMRSFIPSPLVYMPSDVLAGPSGQALAPTYYGTIRPPEELYDLATDPLEQINLADRPRIRGRTSPPPQPRRLTGCARPTIRSCTAPYPASRTTNRAGATHSRRLER